MRLFPRAATIATALFLAACATRQPVAPPPTPTPTPTPAPAPTPTNAAALGFRIVPPVALADAAADRALAAFRISCAAATTRKDQSGLTDYSLWQPVCAEAATVAPGAAAAFFRDRFDWLEVGDGQAFATGYYEPEMPGSRTASPDYPVPIYGKPADLVRCYGPEGKGRGRVDETGQCVLYHDRAAIEDGALAGRGLEIAWARDPVDVFFLQVQGSGRLLLPDGGVMRLGYADQNGRDYVAIGKLLRDRGLLPPGGATMAGIRQWIRDHPAEGRALLRENPSYVFFRELTGPGPLGAMGVPVTPRVSVAADPRFVPLGVPVLVDLDADFADGLWVAQDTGGAIKGANRFDTFWGAGAQAASISGGLSAKGRALVLVPKGTRAAPARP